MRKILDNLSVAETLDGPLPEHFGCAISLDGSLVEGASERLLVIVWGVRSAPQEADRAAHDQWLSQVGLVCELIELVHRRGLDTLLLGGPAATLAACYLVRNHGLAAQVVSQSLAGAGGFRPEAVALLESTIPGRRLVPAPSVQAPQRIAPVAGPQVAAPARPSLTLGGLPALSASQAPLTTPQTAPPPQSGMAFAPIVGGHGERETGHGPVSRVSGEADRQVDAILDRLGGHRAALVGTPGVRPEPPKPEDMIQVVAGDRVVTAQDGGQARDAHAPGEAPEAPGGASG